MLGAVDLRINFHRSHVEGCWGEYRKS